MLTKKRVVEILTEWLQECKDYKDCDEAQFNIVYVCDHLSDYIEHGVVTMDTITAVEILLDNAKDKDDLYFVLSFMIYT